MPISYRIMPDQNLVYVRYIGHMGVEESRRAAQAYMNEPEFNFGLRQVIDLRAVTSHDTDYAEILKLQAEHTEMFQPQLVPQMIVAIADSEMTRAVANMVTRSWEPIDHVVCMQVASFAQAAEVLGLGVHDLDSLLGQRTG